MKQVITALMIFAAALGVLADEKSRSQGPLVNRSCETSYFVEEKRTRKYVNRSSDGRMNND